MATTTAAISVASADLTGNALSLASTNTLYKAGTSVGLDQSTGLGSKYYAAAQSNATLIASGSYDASTANWVYLKNPGSSRDEYFTIELGASNIVIGRLYGGDWMWIPYAGAQDIDISSSATKMTLETMVIYQAA